MDLMERVKAECNKYKDACINCPFFANDDCIVVDEAPCYWDIEAICKALGETSDKEEIVVPEKIDMSSIAMPTPVVTVEIKKVISSGPKTIVIFSDGKKVTITNEKPGVDSLDLYNRMMFAVIKKNVTSKQFEFFCDYCSIDGVPTESVYTNNQLQKKMLRAFVKAVIPDKNFWPAWSHYINHLIYELSDKEQMKIFIVQKPKEKKEVRDGKTP